MRSGPLPSAKSQLKVHNFRAPRSSKSRACAHRTNFIVSRQRQRRRRRRRVAARAVGRSHVKRRSMFNRRKHSLGRIVVVVVSRTPVGLGAQAKPYNAYHAYNALYHIHILYLAITFRRRNFINALARASIARAAPRHSTIQAMHYTRRLQCRTRSLHTLDDSPVASSLSAPTTPTRASASRPSFRIISF